eukprot:CAMPEP_0197303508 /NCGR_PEP_ID=MMETSP0890-20130614/51697_1 /TAXON_ID=44058 ORGANISM="Aureoumbra lagunensis, Strain CCMP1510" /NCGR_SAMPLE_ID=MMETSP0890 /ASSEMBLY_ACC=CAM_ASM_000533 /LENGTH=501 /DNA_ID=CAMNT_0042783337 /DNA_START=101 /DNA_END=1610 /DNA_ORIENTATION=-
MDATTSMEKLHPYLGNLETAWEWQGAVRAELARSMEQFPALKNDEEIMQHLILQLNNSFDDKRLLILNNRIFVKGHFLEYVKNRMHASMFVSLAERYILKNEVMLHYQSSVGSAIKLKSRFLPTTVIAKKSYSVPGILVPNSFFGNGKLFTKWREECDEFEEAGIKYPWSHRDPRVFWRGEIMGELGHGDPNGTVYGVDTLCSRDVGNYERLAAAALTVERPDLFDVRCNKCHPRHDIDVKCPNMPYDDVMRKAVANSSLILDPNFVEQPDYARYQYLLNLPGKTAGSYSRNLNHLWFLGSPIALWDSPAVEFYYPPLKHGITHVSVNRSNVKEILNYVRSDERIQQKLIRNAHRVGRELVCPQCLANYLLDVLDAYRLRFNHGVILDDPKRATDLIKHYLRCDKHNKFYEVSFVRAPHIKGNRELGERKISCDELYAAAAGIQTSKKNQKKPMLHKPLSQTEKKVRKENRRNKAALKLKQLLLAKESAAASKTVVSSTNN